MGWIYRKPTDRTNPTLPGGVYGRYITAGIGVYFLHTAGRMKFILIISDGGKYGMNIPDFVEYKSVPLLTTEYKFHPGLFTKQVTPYYGAAPGVDTGTDTVILPGHPFINGDPVRFLGAHIPEGVTSAKRWVHSVVPGVSFKLSSTAPPVTTPVDILNGIPGGQQIIVAKADAGWDDPVQGLPSFCPEAGTTFSGICYIEGLLPQPYIEATEPDWVDFRVVGVGRKLMNFNSSGVELGVTTDVDLCCNPALADADCIMNEMKRPSTRIDWTSWAALRTASAVKVWQRSTGQPGEGWIGKYYSYTVANPPALASGTLRMTRRDLYIDFNFAAGPGGGLPPDKFIVVWEGQIKAKYSETYTFTCVHNDGVKITVGGTVVINQWVVGNGTHTGTKAMVADALVDVTVEYFEGGAEGGITLQWSSPSQEIELIPKSAVFDKDVQVNRYEFNGAYPRPTEASLVHEEIMLRCPGWDWTDKNGLITYLPPDRPILFDFAYDAIDDDVDATILDKSFQKARRHRRSRRNFVLYSFRNQLLTGYPENFVEENRPRLRELGGGVPSNDPPEELMVMTRSLAERVASVDMIFNTDPAYTLSLSGNRKSSAITKNVLVRVINYIEGDVELEDSICIITAVDRKGNKFDFSMIPISQIPFYDDEPV